MNSDTRALYLELLKKTLMDVVQSDRELYLPIRTMSSTNWKVRVLKHIDSLLMAKGLLVCRNVEVDTEERIQGRGIWPLHAQTMVGINRLNNIQYCIEEIIKDGVDGDLIETGVWRGGSTIFMRAVLRSYAVTDKVVWVADSFAGLPEPNESKYPADKGLEYHSRSELAVSIEEVKANFSKYQMLDDQVKFLKGWFKDTLPNAPISKLSLLRLDGDMYESTMDALVNLYPKLSIGGYIIIDDYKWIEACRKAVSDYRDQHGISDAIEEVDWTAVYWRKTR